jgi:hypothetical protein
MFDGLQDPVVVAVNVEGQDVDFSRAPGLKQKVVNVFARNPGFRDDWLIEQRVLLLSKKCPCFLD